MSLPNFQSDDQVFQLMQNAWATQLNPLLKNPLSNGIILQSQSLATGANVVNHKLGRKLQGWFMVRQRASANIFDTQDTNTSPTLTLNLTSSAPVVVDIYVF